jgi:hypothetical protein
MYYICYTIVMLKNSTILLKSTTREQLKEIGRKNQTYDQLIVELIKLKRSNRQDSPDRRLETLQSSESGRP